MCDSFVNRDTSPGGRRIFSAAIFTRKRAAGKEKGKAILGYDFIRQEGLVVYGATDKCYFSNMAYV